MDPRLSIAVGAMLFGALVACGTAVPGPRLDSFLGDPALEFSAADHGPSPGTPLALVVIQDATGEGASPSLSPNGYEFVTQRVRARFEEALPITVTAVVSPAEMKAYGPGRVPLRSLGQAHGVDWLGVAVFSAVEVEDPQPLALDGTRGGGGAMGSLPGNVTRVFALAELALVEVSSGKRAVRSQGRSATTLEQLANGLQSNAFPVIYREVGQQRVSAPRDDAEAHEVLRSLAFEEALHAASYQLQEVWKIHVATPSGGPG